MSLMCSFLIHPLCMHYNLKTGELWPAITFDKHQPILTVFDKNTTKRVCNQKALHLSTLSNFWTIRGDINCVHLTLFSSSQLAHTHTQPFNGPFSGATQVSQYQKGKTNLDFTEARDSDISMQVCTSLQTDNHASTPPLKWLLVSLQRLLKAIILNVSIHSMRCILF